MTVGPPVGPAVVTCRISASRLESYDNCSWLSRLFSLAGLCAELDALYSPDIHPGTRPDQLHLTFHERPCSYHYPTYKEIVFYFNFSWHSFQTVQLTINERGNGMAPNIGQKVTQCIDAHMCYLFSRRHNDALKIDGWNTFRWLGARLQLSQ